MKKKKKTSIKYPRFFIYYQIFSKIITKNYFPKFFSKISDQDSCPKITILHTYFPK